MTVLEIMIKSRRADLAFRTTEQERWNQRAQDRQAHKDFLEEHRDTGKFSGNYAPQPQQTEPIWTMPWGCWVELEDKDVHCKEWKCMIENFTEEEANTTLHRIHGRRATLSINYKPMQQVQGGVSPCRGNASKTRASLPQATIQQNRRELVTFCQQCWQFTNFRHNKGEIGILPLMVRLLIDTYRTAEHQPGRLRGQLTSQEIQKYVAMCLKPGKSTGPDRCSNELTKTMTDEEFQIVKMWVNEMLTLAEDDDDRFYYFQQ